MARPYHRALLPQVVDDIRALNEVDEAALVDAALQAIVDLAEHRKTGKLLGARHVSGDLTGCRRLRFDLPDERPERFRNIYRLLGSEEKSLAFPVQDAGKFVGSNSAVCLRSSSSRASSASPPGGGGSSTGWTPLAGR
jgi:hypothetical protein